MSSHHQSPKESAPNSATDSAPNSSTDLETDVQSPWQFFIRALKDHPIRAFTIFLSDMAQAAFMLMIPFAVRDIINIIEAYDSTSTAAPLAELLTTPFYSFMAVIFAAAIAARISGLTLLFYAPLVRVKPRLRLIDHLQGHSVNFFQNTLSGALGNKINHACDGLAMSLWMFMFDIWPMVTKLIFSMVLLYFADPSLAFTFIIWTIIYFTVMVCVALGQSWAMQKLSAQRSRITGQVVDMATNIQTVKSYAREDHEKNRLLKTMEDERKAHFKFQYIREFGGIFHTVMSVTIMFLLMRDMLALHGQGTMSIGDLTFVFSIMLIITEQARGLSWGLMGFLENVGQMSDGIKTIMKPRQFIDNVSAQDHTIDQPSIHIKNVDFSYKSNALKSENQDNKNIDELIFKNLTLDIKAHQKIGLIGPSGAGKSSLVNMIMRFYDIDQGSIEIDGKPLHSFTQRSLRDYIAVIPQDTSLFHRSLMENIRYGDLNASDEAVIQAAKTAHAHDFIIGLPQGYDTLVGERGLRLSGGQRQRIAIARAILKDAPILILDEATSALDSESEEAIQNSLHELMEGKTVIAIAHRLSTIQSMDRLLVMNQGEIIEDGNHDELLAHNGLYARLWAKQSGGFLKSPH